MFYRDSGRKYLGFQTRGHAEYAKKGPDVVCAAVSALVINAVNSVEHFTDVPCEVKEDQESGSIALRLSETTAETQLLLESLRYGLETIEKEHGKYIRVGCKEVQEPCCR